MNLKVRRFLPIGTIVKIKDSKKKVMITGFSIEVKDKDDDNVTYYEYLGCMYPEGILNTNNHVLFNNSDIEHIIAYGYVEDKRYIERMMVDNFMDLLEKYDEK